MTQNPEMEPASVTSCPKTWHSQSRGLSAGEWMLGAFVVIGHNVFGIVPNEVPILVAGAVIWRNLLLCCSAGRGFTRCAAACCSHRQKDTQDVGSNWTNETCNGLAALDGLIIKIEPVENGLLPSLIIAFFPVFPHWLPRSETAHRTLAGQDLMPFVRAQLYPIFNLRSKLVP